ncbi:MAG: hypothetical protein A3B38_02070 [Candidatus Levybacteria bacterium RIFCSPLOWO2_01_FULL_36_13]|nr:MAG: hypothetical protein A2684_03305 [Candidatus Levybacteria bacterium RIFCSPHIGHO2_01_FULL_36_15b]OGH35649.1 MAG: hypothetical protein A3B38_02070 [Candidatus Levybacteria bacterium RIFCSPLOWO2_01_FULL_36_13]
MSIKLPMRDSIAMGTRYTNLEAIIVLWKKVQRLPYIKLRDGYIERTKFILPKPEPLVSKVQALGDE